MRLVVTEPVSLDGFIRAPARVGEGLLVGFMLDEWDERAETECDNVLRLATGGDGFGRYRALGVSDTPRTARWTFARRRAPFQDALGPIGKRVVSRHRTTPPGWAMSRAWSVT